MKAIGPAVRVDPARYGESIWAKNRRIERSAQAANPGNLILSPLAGQGHRKANTMAISVGFSNNEGNNGPILPVGQWACVLKNVKVVEQRKYQSDEMEEKLQFTFESLKPAPGADQPGIVSVWCGLNYGGQKAKLTELLDQIFGRTLTQDEVRKLDLEAMAGVIKGYVMVMPHTKMDGTKTTKFGSFIHREAAPYPNPADFPLGLTISPNASRGQSLPSMAPAPPPDWNEAEEEGDDLGDPFAEGNDKRTTEQQGHQIRRAA